jgi:metallo-beta-lactamase class B
MLSRRIAPLLLIVASASAMAQYAPPVMRWNQPRKPFRIVDNVYYVGTNELASYLITTPEGHILVDSGFRATVPQIRANLRTLGFKMEDVKILLSTHAHYDHAGGLAELKRLTHATLYASKADAEALARGGRADFAFNDRFAFEPVTADRIAGDGDKITLGGVTLVAHLTPGHTKGATTWALGDTVIVASTTAPGYRLVHNPKYPGIVTDFETTFQKLRALPVKVYLGGHASAFNLDEKAAGRASFVDPQGYRDYLDRSERAIREAVARQQSGK